MGYVWFWQASLRSPSKWSIGGHPWRLILRSAAATYYNPLRVLRSHLLVTLGILLGALDGDARWRRSAAAGDRFPTAQDKERTDRLLIGAILGGDVDQLLGGVPDDIISSPKTWWLPRVMHACTLLPDTSSPSPLGPGLCPSRSTCPPRRRFSAQCLSWAPMSPWQA
jgi:hypothetical protein